MRHSIKHGDILFWSKIGNAVNGVYINSSSFLEVNKTQVSSAYITGLAPSCSPYDKSFKYMIKSRAPRTEPWGTPMVTVSQLEDISHSKMCGNILTLCFLFSR